VNLELNGLGFLFMEFC